MKDGIGYSMRREFWEMSRKTKSTRRKILLVYRSTEPIGGEIAQAELMFNVDPRENPKDLAAANEFAAAAIRRLVYETRGINLKAAPAVELFEMIAYERGKLKSIL